jgi:hypothetical protein
MTAMTGPSAEPFSLRSIGVAFVRLPAVAGLVFTALALAGCAIGTGGSGNIGGTVSGLGSSLSVILQNNGTDNLTVTSNGSFSFSKSAAVGAAYSVSVLTQPAGQTCVVANGSGTLAAAGDSVTSVTVTCTSSASISGTVSGLKAGTAVTLFDNSSGKTLAVAANGAFSFTNTVAAGASYNVSISVQPVGQTCTIANGSGAIPATGATNVIVTCL